VLHVPLVMGASSRLPLPSRTTAPLLRSGAGDIFHRQDQEVERRRWPDSTRGVALPTWKSRGAPLRRQRHQLIWTDYLSK